MTTLGIVLSLITLCLSLPENDYREGSVEVNYCICVLMRSLYPKAFLADTLIYYWFRWKLIKGELNSGEKALSSFMRNYTNVNFVNTFAIRIYKIYPNIGINMYFLIPPNHKSIQLNRGTNSLPTVRLRNTSIHPSPKPQFPSPIPNPQ